MVGDRTWETVLPVSGLGAEVQAMIGGTHSLNVWAVRDGDQCPDAVQLELTPDELRAMARWTPDDLFAAVQTALWWRVSLACLSAALLGQLAAAGPGFAYTNMLRVFGQALAPQDALAFGALAARALEAAETSV